jgi:hypothetical protein
MCLNQVPTPGTTSALSDRSMRSRSFLRTVHQMRAPQKQNSKFVLTLAIVLTLGVILFQGITVSLGQSLWRRTSHGWESAADSRPLETQASSNDRVYEGRSQLVFKSLGVAIDSESAHAAHRIILPVALAGLIGSLGFWFLLWDRRTMQPQA